MNVPIRVLQVFHGMDCGGAENMIMNIYRNIDRTKVQFDFLVHTRKKCFFDDEIKSLGGKIYHVPYYNVLNHFTYKKIVGNFFIKHPEIKIVHGHLGSCAHVYLNEARHHGCFAIAHSHNTLPTEKTIKNFLYRLFTLRTRKVADYYMACGKQAGYDRFGKEIVMTDRFTILNNAIDAKNYIFDENKRCDVRKSMGLTDDFVIGHIGRFNYQKNHEFLVDVFYEVQKKEKNAKLMMVGDGNLRDKITKKISELGIADKVIMTGVRNDVPDLLQAMDCFVFPSHYEGLGIVAVEAQASGLHTICSDAVPMDAKVSDLFERLSLSRTHKEWADKILKFRNSHDRVNLYSNIVDAGYDITYTSKWIESFYIDKYKKKDVYNKSNIVKNV